MTNLKRIIDEKGVQQRWLAEQVGVTEVSMSRYVSGERIPKAPLAIRMADVLGVDVKELYRWESEECTEECTETHACDLISRQALCDYALNQKDKSVTPNDIMRFPPAQLEQKVEELLPDGTLHLFTDTDLSKVNRVWVSQNGTHYGDLYYADEDLNCGARMEENDEGD